MNSLQRLGREAPWLAFLLVLAVVMFFVAAACSTDDDSNDTTNDSAAAAADTTDSDSTNSDSTNSDSDDTGSNGTGSNDTRSNDTRNNATNPDGDTAPISKPPNDRGLGVPSAQLAQLTPCGQLSLCGEVPAPDGHLIRFRLIPAKTAPLTDGLIAFHFGGPGSNARDSVRRFARTRSPDFVDRYDILGVEQRGTDSTDGVNCGNDALFHQLFTGTVPQPDQLDLYAEWLSGCPLEPFGSLTATEDIAIVLHHLNPARAVFVGYSYGGVIGTLLGSQFPEAVDAIVLDSPGIGFTDPRASIEQARGFATALGNFFDSCDESRRCASAPDGNSEQRFRALLQTYDKPGDLAFGTAFTLYSPLTYGSLDSALAAAYDGDFRQITSLADSYHRRDGANYPSSAEIFQLVICSDGIADYTDDYEVYKADLLTLGIFGELVARGLPDMIGICDHWAGETKPFQLDLSDSEVPVLLVASTNDPVTTWSYAQPFAENSLPEQSGVVVVHSFEHSLWRSGNGCINDTVNAFIFDNTFPRANTPEGYFDCELPS